MALRDILVVLDDGPVSEGRLQLASRIARQQEASLSAVFLRSDRTIPSRVARRVPHLALTAGTSAGLVAAALWEETELRDEREFLERRFRDCVRCVEQGGEWYCLDRADPAVLAKLAKAVDLVVMGQVNPEASAVPSWFRPEDIVVHCGRPVLMVPYIGTFVEVGRRVLIAWDGSREAVRALNDSLPIIASARMVALMTIQPDFRRFQSERVAMQSMLRHLARHDVVARIDETLRGESTIHDVLLSRSVDLAVDMIVAGAYHRSPIREALIGGVSRGLLRHMTVPVMMSH
jgi:nucleotide-binding universal stress UspA family protein